MVPLGVLLGGSGSPDALVAQAPEVARVVLAITAGNLLTCVAVALVARSAVPAEDVAEDKKQK